MIIAMVFVAPYVVDGALLLLLLFMCLFVGCERFTRFQNSKIPKLYDASKQSLYTSITPSTNILTQRHYHRL